ncbi:DUF2065 domain-containing protein [Paragemmobacter straminiformis]|uniref:DUF2065 domain-containing protein n=1 Tax=Paragemmobacter straminiformis TaxID=2045119 RepID=A0A842HZ47_9RHOB|nr:DUF2065 domain-containing protein [Gemmobacter straminiformis]MBC2833942.1 DUF2065 domain-containing protein [Gemmobacter straminiformis]
MTALLHGLGAVLVIEGLAMALAPLRMERLLATLAALSRDQRRAIGLAVLASGVGLLWLAGGL